MGFEELQENGNKSWNHSLEVRKSDLANHSCRVISGKSVDFKE
jgi:hypothetical protein